MLADQGRIVSPKAEADDIWVESVWWGESGGRGQAVGQLEAERAGVQQQQVYLTK